LQENIMEAFRARFICYALLFTAKHVSSFGKKYVCIVLDAGGKQIV